MKKFIIGYSLSICLLSSLISTSQGTFISNAWEGTKIVGMATAAAIAYGIGNDLVTGYICPEYFTEGLLKKLTEQDASKGNKHAQHMLTLKDPIQIGLMWGISQWWWPGSIIGMLTALCARVGSWPKLGPNDFIKPMAIGLIGLYGMALAAGIYGYLASKNDWLSPETKKRLESIANDSLPKSTMPKYTASVFSHVVGLFGGALGLISWTIFKRYQLAHV